MIRSVFNLFVGLSFIVTNVNAVSGPDVDRTLAASCKAKCIQYEIKVKKQCFKFCNLAIRGDSAVNMELRSVGLPGWTSFRKTCKDRCRDTFHEHRELCLDPSTCVPPDQRPFPTPYEQAVCNNCPCCKDEPEFRMAMQGPSEFCRFESDSSALTWDYVTCRCTQHGEEVCGKIGFKTDAAFDDDTCNGRSIRQCQEFLGNNNDFCVGIKPYGIVDWAACEAIFPFDLPQFGHECPSDIATETLECSLY